MVYGFGDEWTDWKSFDKMGPIGVFDSGFGGLTILKSIRAEMPEYDFLYLGDNARAPYGTRSFQNVYHLSLDAVKYLFSKDVHLVILACNTASAKALRTIQQNDLPHLAPDKRVLGVIRPTVEAIGEMSPDHSVGLFGTPGTVNSQSYRLELEKLFPRIRLTQESCPMWVPLVENGESESVGGEYFIQRHVKNLFASEPDLDTIVLACTHYPMLQKSISKYLPTNVKMINQGEVVAEKLKDYLHRHPEIDKNCSKNGRVAFETTDNKEIFELRGEQIFGEKILATQIEI